MLEILYLSIAILAGFQAVLLLRRAGPPQRMYAYMLLVDAALGGWGAAASHAGDATSITELAGALSIFGFVCLVLVPPILRDLARWALGGEHVRLAVWLTDLRELLQPGLGARQERQLVETLGDVRSGRADQVIAALAERKAQVQDPLVRQAIDDRIVLTLLYAARWRDAINAFERTLEGGSLPTSVQLLVEMVRAYGEEGELTKAAELVERLERVPVSREPALVVLFARARLLFLALVGRPDAVKALVAPRGPLGGLPLAARAYWIGTARLYGGDREGARADLSEAVRSAGRDGRARDTAAARLASVDDTALDVPRELPAPVGELADRISERVVAEPPQERVPSLDAVSYRALPVTLALIAVNVALALLVTWRLGPTDDLEVLVRAGANLKAATRAGEWWRVVSSTFLHWGMLHLGVNMLSLWSLGKLVEQMLGSLRFFAVYMLAGVGSSLASTLFGGPYPSAGASGAVFGILGAAIVDLLVRSRQKTFPDRWRRSLLGTLIFVGGANLAIGIFYPLIDQVAHVGGLVCGGAAALLFTPGWRLGRSALVRALAFIVALGALGAIGWSAWGAATTSYADTLEHTGWQRRTLGEVSLELPGSWLVVGPNSARDPTVLLDSSLTVEVVPRADGAAVAKVVADELKKDDQQTTNVSEVPSTFTVPAAWHAQEIRFEYDDGGDQKLAYRKAVFVRPEGDQAIAVTLYVPERRLKQAAPVVQRLLGSARLVKTDKAFNEP